MNRHPNALSEIATINAKKLSRMVGRAWNKCPACHKDNKATANRHTDKQGKVSYQLLCYSPKCIAYKEDKANGRGFGLWIDSAESIEAPAYQANDQSDTDRRQAIASSVWNEAEPINAKWIEQHTPEAKPLQWEVYTEAKRRFGSEALALEAMGIMQGIGIKAGKHQAKARGQSYKDICSMLITPSRIDHDGLVAAINRTMLSPPEGTPKSMALGSHQGSNATIMGSNEGIPVVFIAEGLWKAIACKLLFSDSIVIDAFSLNNIPKAVAYASKKFSHARIIVWQDNDGDKDRIAKTQADCRNIASDCSFMINDNRNVDTDGKPAKASDDLIRTQGFSRAQVIARGMRDKAIIATEKAKLAKRNADQPDHAIVIERYSVTPEAKPAITVANPPIIAVTIEQARERSKEAIRNAHNRNSDTHGNTSLIIAPAGIGKTTTTLELLSTMQASDQELLDAKAKATSTKLSTEDNIVDTPAKHAAILLAFSSHKLIMETKQELHAMYPSKRILVIRGRTHGAEEGKALCNRANESEDWLKAIAETQKQGMIGEFCKACPLYAGCEYIAEQDRIEADSEYDFILATHEHLFTPSSAINAIVNNASNAEHARDDISVRTIIIDETISSIRNSNAPNTYEGIAKLLGATEAKPNTPEKQTPVKLASMLLAGQSINLDESMQEQLNTLAKALIDHGANDDCELQSKKQLIGSANIANDVKKLREALAIDTLQHRRYSLARAIKSIMRDLLASGKKNASDLPAVRISADKGTISYTDTHKPELIRAASTVIALDATPLSTELFERTVSKSKKREAMLTTIELPTNASITHVLTPEGNRQGFARSTALNPNAEAHENPEGLTPSLAASIGYLLDKVNMHGKAACITHKEVAPIIELHLHRLGIGDAVSILTYGSLRGINKLKDIDHLLLIGAQADYISAAIRILRAISNPSDSPIIEGEATSVEAMIEGEQSNRLLVQTHPDQRVEGLARKMQAAEMIQAIARIRAINKPSGQCTITIASDYHIEGLHIDNFIEYDAFINEGTAHYMASVLAAKPDKPFMHASDFGHVEKHQQRAKEGITPKLFEQIAIAISEGRAGQSGITAIALAKGRQKQVHWIVCRTERRTEAISEAIRQGYRLHESEAKPELDWINEATEADYTDTIERYASEATEADYTDTIERYAYQINITPEADQQANADTRTTLCDSTLEEMRIEYAFLCMPAPPNKTASFMDTRRERIERLRLKLAEFPSEGTR